MPPDLPAFTFDLSASGHVVLRLGAAFLLALPVGWDREHSDESAGLRTFPLVAVSSCAFLVMSYMAFPDQQSRVLQGLITGIGFVGGGAILKSDDRVRGTATAASVWTTGAIGAAVALGRLDVAVVISIATFATLRWLHHLDVIRTKSSDASANGR